MKYGGRSGTPQLPIRGHGVGVLASGFTIVETMIVLAVTGALFIAIAASFSGRQDEAEFIHAINTAQAKIQQVILQTSEGFYTNQGNFSCSSASGSVSITPGTYTGTQGTNGGATGGCVFLGKAIQFLVQSGTPNEQYRIYTVAGIQGPTNGSPSPFQTVNPTVVGQPGVDYTSYSDVGAWEYGLHTLFVRADKNPGCTAILCSFGSVGFLMEPGSLTGSGSYSSIAAPVDVVAAYGTTLGQTPTQAGSAISASLQSPTLDVNPPGGVQICLVSGSTKQSGLITIGYQGRQLNVTLDIKADIKC